MLTFYLSNSFMFQPSKQCAFSKTYFFKQNDNLTYDNVATILWGLGLMKSHWELWGRRPGSEKRQIYLEKNEFEERYLTEERETQWNSQACRRGKTIKMECVPSSLNYSMAHQNPCLADATVLRIAFWLSDPGVFSYLGLSGNVQLVFHLPQVNLAWNCHL